MDLAIDASGPIVRIELNRPDAANAMTVAMMYDLSEALARHGADPQARVITLSGRGDHFCRGRDAGGGPPPGEPKPSAYHLHQAAIAPVLDVYRAIAACPLPVVAIVQGDALGFGSAIATIADVTIASDDAHFGFPEIEHDIPPTLAMASAIRNIPPKALTWLVYSAQRIDATRAKEIGIVSHLLRRDRFLDDAEEMMQSLASRPRLVIETIKRYQAKVTGQPLEMASEYAGTLLAMVGTATP